jgi:hypothetical protein
MEVSQKITNNQAWWNVPIIPALRKQRLEDRELKASLG